jgi:hypothetical protein
LGIQKNGGPIPVVSLLLSDLQAMPHLCHLDLQISYVDNLAQPINPNEVFLLSNLTFFRYGGHSVYLNTLVAGFAAPSLRVVRISLTDASPPPILHLSRFIEDIGEHYQAVKVSYDTYNLRLLFFTRLEDIGDHSPRFVLCSGSFSDSMTQMSSAFSAMLTTIRELLVIAPNTANTSKDVILWRRFLLRFPSVKTPDGQYK